MKIAILGTRGIPNNYGGYEQLAEYLSVGLVEKGHEVTVYNNHLHKYKEKEFKGVKIRHIYSPENLIGSSANIIYDYLSLWDAILKKHDIVLECGYQSSAIGFYLAPISKVKIATNMDGLDWKRSKWSPRVQKMTRWFEKLGARKSDIMIADNMGMKDYLDKAYNTDSFFIPYGATIPEKYTIDVLAEYGLESGKYDMLVARLEPENNIETILDGFNQSNSTNKFVVVGNHETNYGNFLKNRYNDNKNIHFVGGIYDLVKLDSVRHFSNFYFHGHSVGGTNPSLLDAMACGCFIVSHNNEFNKNVLGSDALYFSNSNDVSSILSSDVENRDTFVNNNLTKIREVYTWQNVIDLHEKLFIELLSD